MGRLAALWWELRLLWRFRRWLIVVQLGYDLVRRRDLVDGLEGDLTGMEHLEHLPQGLDRHVGVNDSRLQALVPQLPLDERQGVLLLLGRAVQPVSCGSMPERIRRDVLLELPVHNGLVLLAEVYSP